MVGIELFLTPCHKIKPHTFCTTGKKCKFSFHEEKKQFHTHTHTHVLEKQTGRCIKVENTAVVHDPSEKKDIINELKE